MEEKQQRTPVILSEKETYREEDFAISFLFKEAGAEIEFWVFGRTLSYLRSRAVAVMSLCLRFNNKKRLAVCETIEKQYTIEDLLAYLRSLQEENIEVMAYSPFERIQAISAMLFDSPIPLSTHYLTTHDKTDTAYQAAMALFLATGEMNLLTISTLEDSDLLNNNLIDLLSVGPKGQGNPNQSA